MPAPAYAPLHACTLLYIMPAMDLQKATAPLVQQTALAEGQGDRCVPQLHICGASLPHSLLHCYIRSPAQATAEVGLDGNKEINANNNIKTLYQ